MNEERAAGANSGALGTGRVNDQQNSKITLGQQRPPRPVKPAAPLFEFMPRPLVERRQWILWKWEWSVQQKRWAKVPFQTNREWKARSTDPSTWNTFDAVRTAYQRGGFDGVGFVLSAGRSVRVR